MEGALVRDGLRGMRGVRRGWAIHAIVYVSVNLLLVALALLHGRSPILAPALGWGIGLAVHGIVAFVIGGRPRTLERV